MSVDPSFAQWLMGDGLTAVTTDAAVAAAWGTKALTTARMTTIALAADANAEGARQIVFMGMPLAQDEHLMVGEWASFLGRVITISGDRLGYAAGVDVFVVGVQDDLATNISRVTVLRRMT